MEKKIGLLNITFVIFTFLILINISINSSSGDTQKSSSYKISINNSINQPKEAELWNTTTYAYTDYGEEGNGFYARGPGDIYRFGKWEGSDFFSGGTWTNDGRFLCCLYENGTLYDVNPKTLIANQIGDGGVGLNGLAFDPISEKLFGASSYDLYEINIETGEQTHIGSYGGGIPGHMIDIAFDIDGVLYGWDLTSDSLWIIDTDTGDASLVGSLGISINYAQGGSFDYLTDILYLAAYTSTGQLYECDEDTGECTLLGNMPYNWYAFTISYELFMAPPVTSISPDPPIPNGENGWYISDVNVSFTATDSTGIVETFYKINGGDWKIFESPFILSEDGEYLIEYYSYDYVGNFEEVKSSTILIDKTAPDVLLTYEILGGNHWDGWDFKFSLVASDDLSGMDRGEFFVDGELQETVYGPSPEYTWIYHYAGISNYSFLVRGFIINPEIIEDNVSFFALIVRITETPYYDLNVSGCGYDKAGNMNCCEIPQIPELITIKPGIYVLQRLILPNNFKGYLGDFFIFAKFNKS